MLYELEVTLVGGPLTEAFVHANPRVQRTILIRGDQTLAALHKAIFNAFDRFDEHLFEFQIGCKRPMDPSARRYVLPMEVEDPFADLQSAGDLTQTTIEQLELMTTETFWYWFDFGDDWWHAITVTSILDVVPRGQYPKITRKMGESPPQYIDWEEED